MPLSLSDEFSSSSLSYIDLKDGTSVLLINNFLTSSECNEFVSTYVHQLSSATTNYAHRDRYVFDDVELSALLYRRLLKCFQIEKVTDEDGCTWTVSGLNPKFRLSRYRPGKGKRMQDV